MIHLVWLHFDRLSRHAAAYVKAQIIWQSCRKAMCLFSGELLVQQVGGAVQRLEPIRSSLVRGLHIPEQRGSR